MSAQKGNNVKVHYTGRLQDGTVFDSSQGREPLAFQLGAGQMIPGFEAGVLGMEQGQKVTIEIPAKEAYGEHDPEMLIPFSRTQVPEGMNPKVGDNLQVQRPDGGVAQVVVHSMDEENIILDANHPLAGKTLIFDLELVELNA
ncbi:MAG: peptidylprolyl isomerase [Bacteroidota bacterium]